MAWFVRRLVGRYSTLIQEHLIVRMFVRPEKGCVGELIDVELIEDKVDINDDISALLACAA